MGSQSLRIRLVFEDRSILGQSQLSEGMNKSWILIKPKHHRKISDACAHILHIFDLSSSCPNGILLSMEGFVLPPFESTRIFKDKEIVCVRRKGEALVDTIEAAEERNLLDEVEVNRRERVNNGVLLLANEEFDKETGGYQSESEDVEEEKLEDEPAPEVAVLKKRKACTKLQSLKKKKHRLRVTDDAVDEVATDEIDNINNDVSLLGQTCNKEKIKPNEESNKGSVETSKEMVESSPNVKRSQHIQEIAEEVKQASAAPDGAKKVPSRSARRKKAKRQRMREAARISIQPDTFLNPEVAKAEKKEANGCPKGELHQKPAEKRVHKNTMEREENNDNGDGDAEVVPIVVRPGHIRFEPLDEDQTEKEAEVSHSHEAFNWNGITSKKKGQKWGTEKSSTARRNDPQNASKGLSKMLTADTELPIIGQDDFDKLPPCSLPKEGDIIAYRLLELSSSWTPEISSFRVGRVSSYEGGNIVLMPVPEYPIVSEKMDEEDPDKSLYGEDGILEIKFSSLVDVRNVKQSNSNATRKVCDAVNQNPQGNDEDVSPNSVPGSNDNKGNVPKDSVPVVENKAGNPWDELNEALNAKKSELLEENEETGRDSGRNPWSYRALRGSALGPTMALLRSKNSI